MKMFVLNCLFYLLLLLGCNSPSKNIKLGNELPLCKNNSNTEITDMDSEEALQKKIISGNEQKYKNPHIIIVQAKWNCHICRDSVVAFVKKNYMSDKFTFILPFYSQKNYKLNILKTYLKVKSYL